MNINFSDAIQRALQLKTSSFKETELQSVGIYIVGKNEISAELIKNIKVLGIIDDFNPGGYWMDIPVISSSSINREAIIINCSTAIAPVDVHNNMKKRGFSKIFQNSELQALNLSTCPWFVSQQIEEIQKHQDKWNELFKKMSDNASKQTLLDVVRYRLTADYQYMKNYKVRVNEQYFESFMNFHDEFFVDAGGYDGDTSLEFIKRYPDYKKIYFFEPSSKNMDRAKQNLRKFSNIEYKNFGLSESSKIVNFNSENGSASAISENGNEKIKLVKLDEELKGYQVTFIKMDLEGWELKALRGATQIIKEQKPKLAIAVSHNAQDFRLIPSFILSLNPSYKLHLRHYTQGWAETIMFFS